MEKKLWQPRERDNYNGSQLSINSQDMLNFSFAVSARFIIGVHEFQYTQLFPNYLFYENCKMLTIQSITQYYRPPFS